MIEFTTLELHTDPRGFATLWLSRAPKNNAGELPWKDFWLIFAGPTLAGNIIGGSFIFALISHAQVRSDTKKLP